VKIVRHDTVPLSELEDAWKMYESTFSEINGLAVQRHLFYQPEFVEVCLDPRVQKWIAYDDQGLILGMALITNQLDSWSLISPVYFERRYPDRFHRGAIWYIGFVGVDRTRKGSLHVFSALIGGMYPQVRDSAGMAVMDFCAYNADVRRLPEVTRALLTKFNPRTRHYVLDAQSFHGYTFDGEATA